MNQQFDFILEKNNISHDSIRSQQEEGEVLDEKSREGASRMLHIAKKSIAKRLETELPKDTRICGHTITAINEIDNKNATLSPLTSSFRKLSNVLLHNNKLEASSILYPKTGVMHNNSRIVVDTALSSTLLCNSYRICSGRKTSKSTVIFKKCDCRTYNKENAYIRCRQECPRVI